MRGLNCNRPDQILDHLITWSVHQIPSDSQYLCASGFKKTAGMIASVADIFDTREVLFVTKCGGNERKQTQNQFWDFTPQNIEYRPIIRTNFTWGVFVFLTEDSNFEDYQRANKHDMQICCWRASFALHMQNIAHKGEVWQCVLQMFKPRDVYWSHKTLSSWNFMLRKPALGQRALTSAHNRLIWWE